MVKINFFTISQILFSRKILSISLFCLVAFTGYSQSIQLTILDLFHCEQNDTICGVFVDITPTIQNECSEYDLDWAIDFDSDNNVDSIGLGSLVGILPYGNHRVVWAVEDTCDMDWAVQTLELMDCTVPSKACTDDPIELYLDSTCSIELLASSLDPGDLDNCTYDFSFSESTDDVSRMYGQSHTGPQQVELWAVDDSENTDSCVQDLMILDTAELCLPGVSLINCNSILVCTSGESDCASFVHYVPEFIDLCGGLDVMWFIDLNQTGDDDLQGTDSIFRLVEYGVHTVTIIATDSCGADTCDFNLQILDCTLPVAVCPSDTFQYTLDSNCILQLHADDYAQFFSDNCDNVRMSFSDDVNDTVRTYGFMDIGNMEIELWGTDDYFNQTNCVIDARLDKGECQTVEITLCDTIVICNEQDSLCETYIESLPEYSEGCSSITVAYEIDFDRDGMVDSVGEGPISGNWAYGEHLITWIISDDCVSDTCEQVVILYDCVAPEITCVSGLVNITLDENDEALVDAEMAITSSEDNCMLEYAFDSLLTQRDTIFNCDNQGVETLTIYAYDGSGNIATCNVGYNIMAGDDSNCAPPEVNGIVRRPLDRRVVDAVMELEYFPFVLRYDTTDELGQYNFISDEFISVDYTLSATKEDDPMIGVSTFDIVKIQKHLLGIEEFTTFFHFVAADVNESCSISALDMVDIRKMLLGLEQEFPSGKEWVFWETSYDTTAIDALCNIPNFIEFTLDSMHTYDWWGVKVGDVSNAVGFKGEDESEDRSEYSISYNSQFSNEHYLTSFYTDDIISAEGLQLAIDISGLTVEKIHSDLKDFYYNISGNELRIICYNVNGITESTNLFTITSSKELKSNLQIAPSLNAEAYISDFAMSIRLSNRADVNYSESSLVRIYPNPVSGGKILYVQSEDKISSIDVYNTLGTHLGKSENVSTLDLSTITEHSGIIFLKILDISGRATIQKVIVD